MHVTHFSDGKDRVKLRKINIIFTIAVKKAKQDSWERDSQPRKK